MDNAVTGNAVTGAGTFTDQDLFLFNEGTHRRLYEKMGAHRAVVDGVAGVRFSVWAPSARRVSVVGDFNGWKRGATPLEPLRSSGIWTGFVPSLARGEVYKYCIESEHNGHVGEKADPFGLRHEVPPRTASIVWDLEYEWSDQQWMSERANRNSLSAPMSVYELHLGSWRRRVEEDGRPLSYRELASYLVEYVVRMGYTHVEFLPMMEHPFDGSWGYQVTGYFAPTSRFGTPQDFMYLVDQLHLAGVGVLLDWVPAHFPTDAHGLAFFDGTHLFEHADPRKGFHPDWNTAIFNYDRHEVRSFLVSSALFWMDRYHVDGLRVDGVASMLYLDYSRKEGEWIPNEYGGRENLGAIQLLRMTNEAAYSDYPGIQMSAEESTSWPMVSRPTYLGGLGFGLKWDMGWMHDTLEYMKHEPIHRRWHQNQITFRSIYWTHENFVLPLSHDEVVHGKGSLFGKMPGDRWQKFANLRALYGYMWATPGKKLLFMGGDLAQVAEWDHDSSVEWHLEDVEEHAAVQRLVAELNRIYRTEAALHELDCDGAGFEWVSGDDAESSVLAFLRYSKERRQKILCIVHFTPVPRHDFRIGVDDAGFWTEILNSDAAEFGGGGIGNMGGLEASPVPFHGRPLSLCLTLPPLSVTYFRSPVNEPAP